MNMQTELLLSTSGHRRISAMPASFARNAAAGGLVLLSGVAVLLAWRRLAGGMQRPLDLASASSAALFVALCVAAAFSLQRIAPRRGLWLWTMSVVAAASLTLPGMSLVVGVVLWLPTVVCTTIAVIALSRTTKPTTKRSLRTVADRASFRLDERTSSITRRFVDDAGRDCLEAALQARFAAGSRATVLHLAFSPPFAETPEVSWSVKTPPGGDVTNDESAQVRATMVLPYGVRLELKLPAAPSTERALALQLNVVERAPRKS
ncbi:MAG: hypothetical protein C0483_11870 [Pirellula sp.]|nr:hypothetical protein [Pirellula sp.]